MRRRRTGPGRAAVARRRAWCSRLPRTARATGAALAVARVSGEAAPLLFTALNRRFFRRDIFQPVASPTVQIYNHAVSPYDEWHTRGRGPRRPR